MNKLNNYRLVLEQIRQDPIYCRNIQLGEPRRGHPEGTIGAHILELEENLERLREKLSEEHYDILRVLIHVHDTLKPDSRNGVAITDPRSHASLAKEFLARYCEEHDLLQMVQYHDEPYALFLQQRKRGMCDADRWEQLLHRIENWDLFAAFLIIDNCTRGKSPAPLEWFLPKLAQEKAIRWSEVDLIRFDASK